MVESKISSTIKKNPFNFLKSKLIAQSILDGMDLNQIYINYITNNEIIIRSLERRREIVLEIYRRLSNLDSFLLKQFLETDIITSKFILVFAIAKQDNLFREFLHESYRTALHSVKNYISMDDFNLFFARKKESSTVVNKWSLTTIELLSKGYRKMLCDSMLGVRSLKRIEVSKLNIHPKVFNYIKDKGYYSYLQAILGEK